VPARDVHKEAAALLPDLHGLRRHRAGENACPFTTLYWNFIERHASSLANNPRTALMAKNLSRLSEQERAAIRQQAATMLSNLNEL
jgi:deoxyribodipyrimidine photolyase-related protein